MATIALPWIILSVVLVVVLIACYLFTRYYSHKYERQFLPTFVTVLGLTAILLCLCLIPVDIYNISNMPNPELYSRDIRRTYYASYLTLLIFAFVLIPFAYFYYEEEDEDGSTKRRIWQATKYTLFSLVVGIIIIILALVIQSPSKPNDDTSTGKWILNILNSEHYGDRAIGFIVACLALLGLLGWNFYTAYGIVALPINLIKGGVNKKVASEDISHDLNVINDKIKLIEAKYSLTGRAMSRSDRVQLENLHKQEALLKRKSKYVRSEDRGCCHWTKKFLAPFRIALGVVIALIVLLVMISLFLSTLDRIIHSECGLKCAYVMDKPDIFNPLDQALTYASIGFPTDYIAIAIIILVFFFGSISGISRIGIRCVFWKMYSLRKGKTVPQGLLTTCIVAMFIVVVLSIEMLSFAPQYSTFGSQKVQVFNNQTHQLESVPCSMKYVLNQNTSTYLYASERTVSSNGTTSNSTNVCYMSELSKIVQGVSLRISFFSVVFYFENWVFLAFFLLSIVIVLWPRKKKSYEEFDGSESDDEESQLRTYATDE